MLTAQCALGKPVGSGILFVAIHMVRCNSKLRNNLCKKSCPCQPHATIANLGLAVRPLLMAIGILWCQALLDRSVAFENQPDEPAAEMVNLAPKAGRTDRVEATLKVGGHLKTMHGNEIRRLSLKVHADLVYSERHMQPADQAKGWASLRHYERANARIQVEQNDATRELRSGRRVLAAWCDGSQTWLACPTGPLTRDELDLVEIPANTLLLETLLPAKQVSVGSFWDHPPEQMALLLALDAASVSTVRSTLKSCTAEEARVEVAGRVQGAVGGVATDIELAGKYTFNRTLRQITWVALRIKENRSIGHVTAGLEVTANLQVAIAPLTGCQQLTDDVLAGVPPAPTSEMLLLEHVSTAGGYRLLYDRRWHVMDEDAVSVALRFVDRGDLIAQCNAAAVAAPGGEPVTLEAFQRDVQKALGASFGQFARATQGTTPAGYSLLDVLVHGQAAELPIIWHYFHLSRGSDRQVVLAFTYEQGLAEAFAGQAEAIVSALRFEDETAVRPARKSAVR